jgi:membrane-bound metal-dependent hydrolase YbcI (DUF457 family)
MPNRSIHVAAGAAAGLIVAAFHPSLANVNLGWRLLLGGSIGGIGGTLPDLIEPADSPSHRSSAHSYVALGFATNAAFRMDNPIAAILLAGVASHLVLDAGTPAGLPLLARGI